MAESRLASNSECGGLSAVVPPPARGELVQGGGHEVLLVDGGEGEHLAVVRLEPGLESPGPGVQHGDVARAVAHRHLAAVTADRQRADETSRALQKLLL